MRIKRLFFALALAFIAADGASATVIKSPDKIIALIKDVAAAQTPGQFDRILRNASEEPSAADTEKTNAYGIVWYDNWNPRARVWLKGIEAEYLFRDILRDEFLLEALHIEGRIDVELEIRAGYPATIRGRLRLHGADFLWNTGKFALKGVNGYLPFQKTIGTVEGFAVKPPEITEPNLRVDQMIWGDGSIADDVWATASYNDKILRFDRMKLKVMGGNGMGSVVMDHRGARWKMASMVKFDDIDLKRLYEILPGLPLFARIAAAQIEGQVGLVFEAPDRIRLTGKIQSLTPGVIELSPMMHNRIRNLVDNRSVRFQKLVLELVEDKNGNPEAKIDLHRRTAQSLKELLAGTPFSPIMVTIRIPLIPFVQELSN